MDVCRSIKRHFQIKTAIFNLFFFNIFQSSAITADLEAGIHSGQSNVLLHGKSSG